MNPTRPKKPSDARPLNVRFRRTHSEDEATTNASVHCPRRDATLDLETCVRCVHYDGVRAGHDTTELLCNHVSARDDDDANRQPRSASSTPVSHVMTRDVVCVAPTLELEALVALLLDRNIGGVPVVDPEGRPVGIVTKTDVLRRRFEDGDVDVVRTAPLTHGDRGELENGFHGVPSVTTTAGDLMVPTCFTVPEAAPIARAAALMAAERIHRTPVVDEGGRVVGMLSALDLARWLAEREGYPATSRR